MDIEPKVNNWQKSTQNRIQMFLDDYLIGSPISKVRISSQRLILSLFNKGNKQQKQKIIQLLQSRCNKLVIMGKASQDFLQLIKNIFTNCQHQDYKNRIIGNIFHNLENIHFNIVNNANYQFYAFASNLIDFGNQQFKPYLLQANGCFNCFGKIQSKPQSFKMQNFVQTYKIFANQVQYIFKRIYDVKQLLINIKTNGRMRSVSISYMDENKQYKKIGKYKPNQLISLQHAILQGIKFDFDITYQGFKKKIQCVFCSAAEQVNCVCQNCIKKVEYVDISGNFRVIGADEQTISQQLYQDYQKIQQNYTLIKNFHIKMQKKQKININYKPDEMIQIYQRIINNIGYLHKKNSIEKQNSIKQGKEGNKKKNCFSCSYYEMINIVKFLKNIFKKFNNLQLNQEQLDKYKNILYKCLSSNKIQILKINLLQSIAGFISNVDQKNIRKQFNNQSNKYLSQLIIKILIALKQKKFINQCLIDQQLSQIKQILKQKTNLFKIQEKIKIFVCFFLQWEFLSLVLQNTFTHSTQITQLKIQQFNQLKTIIDFDLNEVFNLPLDSYLKAFLKIIPTSVLPSASLQIQDCQFLEYVQNKIPQIKKQRIQQSIICCPTPIIKLDMFTNLPVLIQKLPVKESMKIMNNLFEYRRVWNINIMKAVNKYQMKLQQLPAQQQIYLCLYGYAKSKQYLYIQKLFKLLVPQRLQFIIKLQAPYNEIDSYSIQYPYLPIREVKSEDLQGDTIKSLHDWIYNQLVKLNQAMPLDIIVQKNIIDNMDFPIQLVYQKIAQNKSKKVIGNKQYDYFKVIYRIQGILGQPKQRSIGNLRDHKLQTCISLASHFLNKFSDQYPKKIGLDVLISILEDIQPGNQMQDKKVLLFQILLTLSMNQAICKKIVQGQYGDSIINATVRLMSFQNEKCAKITNFLLQLSSKVIDEANQQMINLRKGSAGEYRKMSGGGMQIQQSVVSDSKNKVQYILQKITDCENTYQKTGNNLYRDIERRLIKLLPFCSKDEIQSTRLLYNYFGVSNWLIKSSIKLQNVFIFLDSLSQSYITFKMIARQNGITDQIIKNIINSIRKQQKQSIIQEKKLSVNKIQTQSALMLLCALIQGDQELQRNIFDIKLFHNIYQISQIAPKKANEINAGRVPQICYKIIKYLSQGKIVDIKIIQYLDEKKKKQKQKLQPKKNKKWELMKNKQKNTLIKKIQQINQEELDKDFIICSSCQEGYSKKKDILGLYIYFIKNQIPIFYNTWWKQNKKLTSFSSTTYFTAIHFQCHVKAYQADQKIGRNQWDGALIRNMDVLCNSWIPIKGPKTTNEQFTRCQKKYFQKNKNGNYWNVVNDLQSLLQKFSIQFDFAKQSKGSSSSHNCKYIPVLIGFSSHMMDRNGGCNIIQEGIHYLLENPPKKLNIINLMICYCIFTMSYQEFDKNKSSFLKWIISSKNDQSLDKQFQCIKSSLLLLKIVQQIFGIIHKPMTSFENTSANPPVKIYKQLDSFLAAHMQQIIPQFESLNDKYKTRFTKYTTLAQFEL